jgi:hypothetical protein
MPDLVKIGPAGTLRLEIDDPQDQYLRTATGEIRGWFAASDLDIPEDYWFEVGSVRIPHRTVRRADVEDVMPGYAIAGFVITYDLAEYLPYIDGQQWKVQLILPDFRPKLLKFTIAESALGNCLAAASDI